MPQTSSGLPAEAAEKALAAAEELGVARQTLLARAGIASTAAAISYEALCDLYERASEMTGDLAFGLHVGERTSTRMYGQLGYAVANSGSFGDALANLRDFQRLWTDAVGFEIRQRRGMVAVRYWHQGEIEPGRRRQESEQMLAAVLGFARWSLDEPVKPEHVRFEHAAPADPSEHKRVFGGRMTFEAPTTEILFPERLLTRPIAKADLVLGELIRGQAAGALTELLRREPLLDRLSRAVEAALTEQRGLSLAAQAAALGIGPRTLQRHLRRRGLTFTRLVDEVRMKIAKSLLDEPNLALGQIAFRLGYSQTSAFHRTFRRLNGTTPGDYRRQLRDEDPD